MAGRKPKKPQTKPKAGGSQTKALAPPLRGGVGDLPAGNNPFAGLMAAEDAAFDPEMRRLAVDRPTVLANTAKRMSVKQADSLQQIADSTLAAAYNHRAAPDAGTDLYARAFQALDQQARARLLGALDPADARFVDQMFGGRQTTLTEAVDAEAVAPATTSNRPLSAQERAKARAREALAEQGLEEIPVVNLSERMALDSGGQQYVAGMTPDNTRVVETPDGWTQEQVARGYRVITLAPEVAPPARRGGGGGEPSFAAQRIELQRSRIAGQRAKTDTDYYFAIESAKQAKDGYEVERLLKEKKAVDQQFKAILDDPDQVSALARADAEADFADQMARLDSAYESATDPAYRTELQRKKAILEERAATDLASFNPQAATDAASAAPAPTAQRTVVEVLKDRAGEFTGEAPKPSQFGESNPEFGQTTTHIRRKPGTSPDRIVADRLTPTDFEQLSPAVQRAIARGNEIQDAIEDFEQYDPDFLDTPRGQILAREMKGILDEHPEALSFINDPSLMSRQVPARRDLVQAEEGRSALPPNMRLTNYIGGDERMNMRVATQPERRAGRYADIPADAPNRMAFILLRDAEEATKQGVTLDTYRRMKGSKRLTDEDRAAAAAGKNPKKQFAERVEVVLPPTEEISQRINRGRGGAQADVDYRGPTQPRGARPAPEVTLSAERIAELDAAAEQARQRIASGADAGPAAAVEDLTADPDYYKTLQAVDVQKLPGSATGSPAQVRFDRDYALREGKSDIEKFREQIFRLANETVDPEKVGVSSRGLMIGSDGGAGGGVMRGDLGDDMRNVAMRDALGGDDPIRTKAGRGKGPRDGRRAKLLALDKIIPAWRGYMQFVEGSQIVTRRPTALEVSGFILDQLDIPDPSMAARLEVHVQQAMDALEGSKPSGRAARAAGMVYQPNNSYRKFMESEAASRRAPGDQRPLYDEASALTAREAAAQNRAAFDATSEAKFQPADQPGPVVIDAQSEPVFSPEAGISADAPPASDPTIDAAVSAFSKMRKGGQGGGSSTNIANLVALATAGLAGGSAFAGEDNPDLPPVEYLAMARTPRNAARTAAKASGGAAKQTNPKRKQAAGAAATGTGTGGAAATGPQTLPQRGGRGKQGGGTTATQTTQTAAGGGQQPPNTTTTTAAAAASPPPAPRQPMFPDSPTARAVGPIAGFAGRHIPDIAALAAGGVSVPFLVGLARRGIHYMTEPLGPPSGNPEAEMEAFFKGGVFEATPEERRSSPPAAAPLPAPAMNQGSSNNIDVLRQMLNNPRRMV